MKQIRCIRDCWWRTRHYPGDPPFMVEDDVKVPRHFEEIETAGRPPDVEPDLKQLTKEQLQAYGSLNYGLDLDIEARTKKEMIREIEAAKNASTEEEKPESIESE